MTAADFEATLKLAGYRDIATKTMEHRPSNTGHAHDYSVRGLVTTGEFIISCGGSPRSYKAGDIFEVAAGELHTEAVGPDGTCVTTGRMYKAD